MHWIKINKFMNEMIISTVSTDALKHEKRDKN